MTGRHQAASPKLATIHYRESPLLLDFSEVSPNPDFRKQRGVAEGPRYTGSRFFRIQKGVLE